MGVAQIHNTTMVPSKVELLSGWLPQQPWFLSGEAIALTRVGGFRLDDPDGQVGIEFMFVRNDGSGTDVTTYQVPLTYRSEPLPSAESALIGTSEHGVLGRRWIYDGTSDPVLIDQMFALLQGTALPQHQTLSDTVDPSGVKDTHGLSRLTVGAFETHHDADGTTVTIQARDGSGAERPVAVRVMRVLTGQASPPLRRADSTGLSASVTAPWRGLDESHVRGAVLVSGSSG
jgi:hypothetical protein